MEHSERFLRIVNDAKTQIREIGVAEVKRKQDAGQRFHLVDVREELSEWAKTRLRGHLRLAGTLGTSRRPFPDLGAEIILYCGGGYRSALAADSLQKMGYSRVSPWMGAGRPGTKRASPSRNDVFGLL